ncbi:MAG: ABC transporter ATP-binding protein [Acidimicrobiales bacterium]
MPVPAVVVEELSHSFDTARGALTVLDGIELRVTTGEHLAVVGRSGSGKSTLLSLLGGLETPQHGRVEVLGHLLGELGRDELARFRATQVGFVFQHFGLLDTLTALENVELAGAIAGAPRAARRAQAETRLEQVGLLARRDHRPPALSGGERQRVAIARALVNEPRLVLADEPTGNLDDEAAATVADLLASLPSTNGATVVVVTHDHALADRADRVVRLRGGRVHGADSGAAVPG